MESFASAVSKGRDTRALRTDRELPRAPWTRLEEGFRLPSASRDTSPWQLRAKVPSPLSEPARDSSSERPRTVGKDDIFASLPKNEVGRQVMRDQVEWLRCHVPTVDA